MVTRRKSGSARSERLEARCTPEQKELFQHAAALAGLSLSDFMLSSLQEAAEQRIERAKLIRLTVEESSDLFEALRNPPEPAEALRQAFALHRALIEGE